jgi:anaerobic selenocysteine-containing dehydrogenase
MAEEMLTPGQGRIRGFITSCGNPVLSTPNGRLLDKAFESLEFMLSIDIYINETTRHADIILPPATGLDTPHYSLAFQNLAIRNHTRYSPPVFEKEPDARYDWEIYRALHHSYISHVEPEKCSDFYFQLTPELMLTHGLSSGPYNISYEDIVNATHGIDFGPLVSMLPDGLCTKDKKLSLLPTLYRDALSQLEIPSPKGPQFMMIGRRDLRSNNSWLHNSPTLTKGRNRCTALVNTEDAAILKIQEGDLVSVKSRVGCVTIPASITDDIMRGVISIPHGWGHDREGIQLTNAEMVPGISMNDLVDEQVTDKLTGTAIISGVPVEMEKV